MRPNVRFVDLGRCVLFHMFTDRRDVITGNTTFWESMVPSGCHFGPGPKANFRTQSWRKSNYFIYSFFVTFCEESYGDIVYVI